MEGTHSAEILLAEMTKGRHPEFGVRWGKRFHSDVFCLKTPNQTDRYSRLTYLGSYITSVSDKPHSPLPCAGWKMRCGHVCLEQNDEKADHFRCCGKRLP